MKWSIYNRIYKQGEHSNALYNYATDEIMILDKRLCEILYSHKDNIDQLADIHPTLYQALSEKEFIVRNDIDEPYSELNKIRKHLSNSGILRITINPTLDCNLRCWYCYESHLKGSHISELTLNSIKLFLTQKISKHEGTYVFLTFFGGEPLLEAHRSILPLLQHTQNLCNRYKKELEVSFVSNATLLTPSLIDKIKDITSDVTIQIPFDGDRELHDKTKHYANQKGSFQEVYKNALYALMHGFYINYRFNYTNQNILSFKILLKQILEDAKGFEDKYAIYFQKVWQEQRTELMIKTLAEIKSFLKGKNINCNLLGSKAISHFCYADYDNSFVINYNGDIYKCTARNFSPDNRIGMLDNDGYINYNSNYKIRKLKQFSLDCQNCSILPICTICSQERMEKSINNHCPRPMSKEGKEGSILDRYQKLIYNFSVK